MAMGAAVGMGRLEELLAKVALVDERSQAVRRLATDLETELFGARQEPNMAPPEEASGQGLVGSSIRTLEVALRQLELALDALDRMRSDLPEERIERSQIHFSGRAQYLGDEHAARPRHAPRIREIHDGDLHRDYEGPIEGLAARGQLRDDGHEALRKEAEEARARLESYQKGMRNPRAGSGRDNMDAEEGGSR